jgi:hypothetical protein
VNLDSSAQSGREWEGYHRWYWQDAASPFLRSGVVVHKRVAGRGDGGSGGGVLSLHGRRLTRTHPALHSGREVVALAANVEEWRAMLMSHFGMRLDDVRAEEAERLFGGILEREREREGEKERASL